MKLTKRFVYAAALMTACIFMLSACGKKSEDAAAEPVVSDAPQELNLYIWSEYLDPEIVTDFEKKYNCKVVISLYESNEEMLGKLQAGGVSQYDLVVPSDFIIESLIKLNLLKPLDHTKIPNLANLKETFVNPGFDPGNKYTAAYQWGTVGLVYSKAKFPEGVTSWKSIFEAPEGVKFMFFDSEREMIGAVLRYKGYSVNNLDKTELMGAAKMMIADKKKAGFMGFEGNVGGLNKVQAGTVDVAMAYNGDVIQAMAEDPNVGFVNPSEGTVVWVDSLCIPREAPNTDLAYKFINYILDAKVGAKLSNYNQFASPNKASMPYITPEDLANPAIYPDAATEKRLEYVLEVPGGSAIFGELWKTIKTR